jgi:hypothetical protein
LQIDVRIVAAGGASGLEGSTQPSTPVRVEVESEDPGAVASADVTGGRFSFARVAPRVVRLRFMGPIDTDVIRTDWFRI